MSRSQFTVLCNVELTQKIIISMNAVIILESERPSLFCLLNYSFLDTLVKAIAALLVTFKTSVITRAYLPCGIDISKDNIKQTLQGLRCALSQI